MMRLVRVASCAPVDVTEAVATAAVATAAAGLVAVGSAREAVATAKGMQPKPNPFSGRTHR